MSINLSGSRDLRTRSVLAGLAIGISLLTGCSSGASQRPTETSSTAPSTSDPVAADATTTTRLTADTTIAATTTEASATSTSTSTTEAESLILRGDGVGSFDLGMPYTAVLAGLSARLTFKTDDAYEYPVADENGGHRTADENQGFVAPYGRIVCWTDGAAGQLCAAFGGDDATALSFVGWTYSGDVLHTVSGLTGGSLWSDFPTLIGPEQAGCSSETSGTFDGVLFTVVSAGAPFGSFDEAGNFLSGGDVNPAEVSVTGLATGDFPYDTNADC